MARNPAITATALSMVAGNYGAAASRRASGSARLPKTAQQMLASAAADADKWLATKGVHAQPMELSLGPPVDGEHTGYGWYGTGKVQIDPSYLTNVNKVLQNRKAPRKGRIAALAGMWRIMAHERGHNANLQHTPGGIMDEGWVAPPGEAYQWAAAQLGPPAKKRLR